jgi:hypothetical protein
MAPNLVCAGVAAQAANGHASQNVTRMPPGFDKNPRLPGYYRKHNPGDRPL